MCSEETEFQNEIEKLLKEKLNSEIVEGFEPTDTADAKRASTQSKGSFAKKKKPSNMNSSEGNTQRKRPFAKKINQQILLIEREMLRQKEDINIFYCKDAMYY